MSKEISQKLLSVCDKSGNASGELLYLVRGAYTLPWTEVDKRIKDLGTQLSQNPHPGQIKSDLRLGQSLDETIQSWEANGLPIHITTMSDN